MERIISIGCVLTIIVSTQGFLLPASSSALSSAVSLASPSDTRIDVSVSRLRCRQGQRERTPIAMNKGFGPPKPEKKSVPKSKGRIEADKAAKDYDELAAAGIPEYNIFIKPRGTEDYLPAGVMTVPRSQQISQAVFEQEDNLKKAAFRMYAKLQNFEEFDYGYTLKMFPDDPITPIEVRAPSTNAFGRFFEGLLSPVNTAGMKGPEIEPPAPPTPPS